MNHNIGIIGKGRLGTALSRLLADRGVNTRQIAGRDAAGVRDLPLHSVHIVIAVADHAIEHVAEELAKADRTPSVVLHTSGAAGPGALSTLAERGVATGVLHPLQTIPNAERGRALLSGATFVIAGASAAIAWSRSLLELLGGIGLSIDPDHWSEYHAAAVMASNYQVTLVDCALELMQQAGMDRDRARNSLASILRATIENILALGTEEALTGPIRRGDVATVRLHLRALRNAPRGTMELYQAAGRRTVILAERAGLPKEQAGELNAALSA